MHSASCIMHRIRHSGFEAVALHKDGREYLQANTKNPVYPNGKQDFLLYLGCLNYEQKENILLAITPF